jgi:hypothetical protein
MVPSHTFRQHNDRTHFSKLYGSAQIENVCEADNRFDTRALAVPWTEQLEAIQKGRDVTC